MPTEPKYFDGVIEGDKIFERAFNREHPQIGVTLAVYRQLEQEYSQLIEEHNDYQQLLLKHDLIKPPLTTEEQLKKLLDFAERQAEQIDKINKRIDRIMDEANGNTESYQNLKDNRGGKTGSKKGSEHRPLDN